MLVLDPLLYGGHHNTISRPSQQSYKYILLISMSPVVCGQTVRHFMAIKLIEIQSVFPLLIWPGVKISGQIRDSKDWCGVTFCCKMRSCKLQETVRTQLRDSPEICLFYILYSSFQVFAKSVCFWRI